MAKGIVYLVAIMDWASRLVLAWRLSNTLDSQFCIEALEEALAQYGPPEIFNTDQEAQFTSQAFTHALKDGGVVISMDGKGWWVDNVLVERLWRSVKHEEVYLKAHDSTQEAHNQLTHYFHFYNAERLHQALNRYTPDAVYFGNLDKPKAAYITCRNFTY
jgi:putative transposase